jgi:hypothetical protein
MVDCEEWLKGMFTQEDIILGHDDNQECRLGALSAAINPIEKKVIIYKGNPN